MSDAALIFRQGPYSQEQQVFADSRILTHLNQTFLLLIIFGSYFLSQSYMAVFFSGEGII